MLRCFVSMLLLLICSDASAQVNALDPNKLKHLEALVRDQMASQDVPGLSLVVIQSGQVVYQNGFGWASIPSHGDAVPMQVDTPTALGSLSKSFTAIAVMQLVEEGRLQLEDFASKHLVELSAPVDERIRKITVHQLLNHTSGFSTYDGNFGQANYAAQTDALDVAAQRLAKVGLVKDPGTGFEYSNANYQLLGLVLERLDQRSFEESVQTRVLDRLKLSNSFIRTPNRPDQVAAVGHRYWLHKSVAFKKPLPRTVVAQGGVYASAADVATYLLDLMSEQPRLLSAKARDQMFKITEAGATSGYGLGWFIEPHNSERLIFHSGTNPGYEVEAGFLSGTHAGYVVLTNANSGFAAGDVAGVVSSIKQLLFGDKVTARAPPWINRLVLVVFVLLTLGLLVASVRWFKRLVFGVPEVLQVRFAEQDLLLSLVVPGVLLLGLAVLLLWYLPRLSSIPLVGLQAFAPDIGLALLAASLLAGLLAILRTVTLVRYRKPNNG